MKIQGFEAGAPFYDNRRFRVGFRRSGEFTTVQAEILETYGRSLQALEEGTRNPSTKEEKAFVEVCRGKKEPKTAVEQAWAKYKSLVNKKHTVNAFGSSFRPEVEDSEDDVEGEDLGQVEEVDEDEEEDQ
jgi:uncharacterized protein YifE (UPF0438 family)